MSQPPFNTDFEYDEWFEVKQEKKILDDYFGEEVQKDGRGEINTSRTS